MRILFIRGWGGFAALLVLGAGGAGGTGIGIALGGAGSGGNWGTVVGFLLAATALWFGGRAINDKPDDQHRLLGIPIQYLAVFAAGVAIFVALRLLAG